MRTIKYIISTLLVFLSFVNVNAESYYTSHYFEVNVDGKSIDDDFYVTFLQCTADLEMISRATNHEFEDLSKDVSIRYSAKLDSSAYFIIKSSITQQMENCLLSPVAYGVTIIE